MDNILIEIILLTGAATLVVTICHAIKLPAIVGFIFTGIVIGPSGFQAVPSLPDANSLTKIAAIFLMFMIGLEFSFPALKNLKHQFFRLGSLQVLLTIGMVLVFGLLLTDFTFNRILLWGFLISLSSTALVLKILYESREMATPRGQNSIGILLFQDVAVIPMMFLLPILAATSIEAGTFSIGSIIIWLAKIIGLIALVYLLAKIVLPQLLDRIVKTRSQELFFFSVVFICLGTGYLFEITGLSLSLGAFVAGILISGSPFVHQTQSVFVHIRDSFLGLFFASIGMLLDLEFLWQNLGNILVLSLLIFLLKSSVLMLTCIFNRIPLRTAIVTTLTLCQIGEFSFILLSRGVELGILDSTDNQYFLTMSIISMIATPFMYRLAPRVAHSKPLMKWRSFLPTNESDQVIKSLESKEDQQQESQDSSFMPRTIIVGFGIGGKNVAGALQSLKIPVRVIEMDYGVVKELKKDIDIVYGDASQKDVLQHAGIKDAKLIVLADSGGSTTPFIIQTIRQLRPDIPIVVRAQYMRDAALLKVEPGVQIVVAEVETVSKLIASALKTYGVESQTIYDYILSARTQLSTNHAITKTQASQDMGLPGWEALSSIRPFVIQKKYYAIGKSLADLELTQKARATVVSVYRSGLGSTIPRSDFVIKNNDVLYIIASSNDFSRAEELLQSGSVVG